VTTLVFETGRPARIDYSDVSGVIGQVASREWGLRSSVGVPVSAESRLWGCIVVAFSGQELRLLPADTEARLASFTELVATAIANADSRAELARLAEEQAALRRVATLALANAAKHARASAVQVELDALDAVVRLGIRDDGIGGADPAQGSGLTGLRDRIEALGGTLEVTSPAGSGTTLLIEIPL
jgi:signal transduction histidine kinase